MQVEVDRMEEVPPLMRESEPPLMVNTSASRLNNRCAPLN
jgi:hypothetical protein